MINHKIMLLLFVLVAAVQLLVPAKMAFDGEQILANGKEFKFKTAPVDPNDPFRGKYLTLRYKEDHYFSSNEEWTRGEKIYVTLAEDREGFATIQSIAKTPPEKTANYVMAKVDYVDEAEGVVHLNYPFDRFYVEESKAALAEKVYIDLQNDSSKITYALVNVKAGSAVLKDLRIEGRSILDRLPAPTPKKAQ